MLERSRLCFVVLLLFLGGCVTPAPEVAEQAAAAPKAPPAAPVKEPPSRLEEAKAMLAQAETDIQRARAKRALWLKAWEDLLAARRAMASNDHPTAIRHAKRASELAQLGLEQLAYPAVK
jgi:flagellar basal body L-ring protein FlgH